MLHIIKLLIIFINLQNLIKKELFKNDLFFAYLAAETFCKFDYKIDIDINKTIEYLQSLNKEFSNKININNCYIWFLGKNYDVFYNEKDFNMDFLINQPSPLSPSEYLIKNLLE